MRIKLKITLGVGLLFLFIILLSALGTLYINALRKDTENILVANYNTLDYSRKMFIALDEDISLKSVQAKFQLILNHQKNNITEIGEQEVTDKLSQDFENIKIDPNNIKNFKLIRKDLTDIMFLNMQAIERKSNIAKSTANSAIFWISIIGTICFIIAFVLLINLPGNIANPIKQLIESIKKIADKQYSQRVNFESGPIEFKEVAIAFNSMAEKLEEYNKSKISKILFEKKRIETLINKMNDPIIGLDEKTVILFANEEAFKVLGLKESEVLGKDAVDIALSNDLMRLLVKGLLIYKTNENKSPIKIFADNKESYFEKEIIPISIIPTGELESKQIGHFIILKNITPFKELDFAKTNFIATISHEFKTPIASIKLGIQLLENFNIGLLNDEQTQLVEGIKEDTNRLLKFTSELLNLSQIESGKIQMVIRESNVEEILKYCIKANKTLADQRNIGIEILNKNQLKSILADSEKTTWVITNLISNAIRYSNENSKIEINIHQNSEKTIIEVTDFGQGISEEHQEKIFEKYFRVPGTNKEGTGLGLAISKEFIEAQGGKIMVSSAL